ncbi:hypothetical protein [Streptomyces puniciscabiei]|uniref:hypothetical protein n=1 Tax=Streptomyces puniciscabiei TaxID=164348 RepID=UPI0006EBCDD7|nr:hypothetical protein [Streptomyces puniciscabiei]
MATTDQTALFEPPKTREISDGAIALALQCSLLPRRLRGGIAVEAASRYLPADMDAGVGGD